MDMNQIDPLPLFMEEIVTCSFTHWLSINHETTEIVIDYRRKDSTLI